MGIRLLVVRIRNCIFPCVCFARHRNGSSHPFRIGTSDNDRDCIKIRRESWSRAMDWFGCSDIRPFISCDARDFRSRTTRSTADVRCRDCVGSLLDPRQGSFVTSDHDSRQFHSVCTHGDHCKRDCIFRHSYGTIRHHARAYIRNSDFGAWIRSLVQGTSWPDNHPSLSCTTLGAGSGRLWRSRFSFGETTSKADRRKRFDTWRGGFGCHKTQCKRNKTAGKLDHRV